MADIDLKSIEAQIASLSPEEIKKQLVDIKTRQKVMQKKYYDKDRAKAQRDKKAAEIKVLVERAKQLGFYDEILEQANEQADAKLAVEEAEGAEATGK